MELKETKDEPGAKKKDPGKHGADAETRKRRLAVEVALRTT